MDKKLYDSHICRRQNIHHLQHPTIWVSIFRPGGSTTINPNLVGVLNDRCLLIALVPLLQYHVNIYIPTESHRHPMIYAVPRYLYPMFMIAIHSWLVV